MEESGAGKFVEREFLFDLILNKTDIEKGHLPIPGTLVETHFLQPFTLGSSLSSNLSIEKRFLDSDGKNWVFTVSSFHGDGDGVLYALSGRWDSFLKGKNLVSGDTVSFWRNPGNGEDDVFYIDYEKVSDANAYQVSDEMIRFFGSSVEGWSAEGIFHDCGNQCLFEDCGKSAQNSATGKRGLCNFHSCMVWSGESCSKQTTESSTVTAMVASDSTSPKKLLASEMSLCSSADEKIPDLGMSEMAEEKEMMFHKTLTPFDVGKFMVIPKRHALVYLPQFFSNKKDILLNVEDFTGKMWRFRCSYWKHSQNYVLSNGWSRFVKAKKLAAGDIVTFYRRVGKNNKNKLFISCSNNALTPPFVNLSLSLRSPLEPVSPSPSLPSLPLNFDLHSTLNTGVPFPEIDETANLFNSSPLSSDCHSPHHLISSPFDAIIHDDAFILCALYPPDYEFEKDTLLQLWTADGVFVKEPMERIAGQFFDDCLSKGYFKFSRANLVTGEAMYKFSGESSLGSLWTSTDSFIAGIDSISYLNDISPEVSHVSIRCRCLKDFSAFRTFKRFEQLRILMFLQGHESSFQQIPRDFFASLKLLRVLDLSRTPLLELPSSIGNMKCLCYLDLSETPIKRLPEVIDRLENLQTLKLKGCWNLSTLPRGMRKLINLRHLHFDILSQLQSMPPGMGGLTNIQTLSAFLIGSEEDCNIRQLKNLNNLSGSFCISRLENVLTEDEAMEAQLCYKSHIRTLELHWCNSLEDEDIIACQGKVISSLQPNPSLEELRISCFGGVKLPSWICNTVFSMLVSINLFRCENCEFLPSLGQLPSLRLLQMVDFHKVKVIDHDFYGRLAVQGHVAFPKLEKLTIENMFSLEEWTGIRCSDFPCLVKLTVKHCPKLSSLCNLSSFCSLEYLEISHCTVLDTCLDGSLPVPDDTFIIEDCPLISARLLRNGGLEWLRVSHVPHVWIDHKELSFSQ